MFGAMFSLCAPRKWHIKNFLIRDGVRVKTPPSKRVGGTGAYNQKVAFSKPEKFLLQKEHCFNILRDNCHWRLVVYPMLLGSNHPQLMIDQWKYEYYAGWWWKNICSITFSNSEKYITLHNITLHVDKNNVMNDVSRKLTCIWYIISSLESLLRCWESITFL